MALSVPIEECGRDALANDRPGFDRSNSMGPICDRTGCALAVAAARTTFEISGRAPCGSFEAFGTDAVVAVREAMLPFHLTDKYHVTINGPPPGTGLIRRYGSARFIEGGRVEWEDGLR
jgi:hypothetical protein